MVRLACPCAHSLGTNVEQMRGFGGRISDAAAHSAAAVDEGRLHAPPRQLRGKDRARGPAADDRNRHRRSDLVVRPASGSAAPALPAGHMVVHVGDGLARRLGEHAGDDRMNQAGQPCADQASADRDRADAVALPSSSRASADVPGTCRWASPVPCPLYPASPSASILRMTGDPDRIRTCGPTD